MGLFDSIKTLFLKNKKDLTISGYTYCINCAITIDKDQELCDNCGHNQKIPIKKKNVSVDELLYAVFIDFYDNNQYNQMIKYFTQFLNDFYQETVVEEKYDQIIGELIIFRLSLMYVVIITHFSNNKNIQKIAETTVCKIYEIIETVFGKENLEYTKYLCGKMNKEIWKAFKHDNPIKAIAGILKIILLYRDKRVNETIGIVNFVKQVGMPSLTPSTHMTMLIFFVVEHLIMRQKILLNKFEISN